MDVDVMISKNTVEYVGRKGPVDKLKKKGFLYGILIIPIAGGHFYDGKTKRTNLDGNP